MGNKSAYTQDQQRAFVARWDAAGSAEARAEVARSADVSEGTIKRWRMLLNLQAGDTSSAGKDAKREGARRQHVPPGQATWTEADTEVFHAWIREGKASSDPLNLDSMLLLHEVAEAMQFQVDRRTAYVQAVFERAYELAEDLTDAPSAPSIRERSQVVGGYIAANVPDLDRMIAERKTIRMRVTRTPGPPTAEEKARLRELVRGCPAHLIAEYRSAVKAQKVALTAARGTATATHEDIETAKAGFLNL